jgi:nitrite reductase/ring-hydroxylating ferredoxin subunit
LIAIAGWMGGTLVYRNQIGVDHRYANAGKWKEEYFDKNTGEVEVASIDELKTNAMKLLHFKNKRIVLAKTEERYFAFEDSCPHRGASLADGSLMCGMVQCPWHGSQFNVASGELKNGPAKQGIKTYAVKEKNGKVMLFFEQ